MSQSRATEILEAWRATADSVGMPPQPPRRAKGLQRTSAFGLVGASLIVVVVLVALWSGGKLPAGHAGGSSTSAPQDASSPPSISVTPGAEMSDYPSEAASTLPLPNPGGTCSASQLALGPATAGFTFATVSYRHAYFNQQLTNRGSDCVLSLPKEIGVASAAELWRLVSVNNTGNESYHIGSGRSFEIDFSVFWWVGANDANGDPLYTAPPCVGSLRDVTHVALPVASGALAIDLATAVQEAGPSVPWREVCDTPKSISFEIKPR